jgi:hypothetical protein
MQKIAQRKNNLARLGKMDIHMHDRSEKLICSSGQKQIYHFGGGGVDGFVVLKWFLEEYDKF